MITPNEEIKLKEEVAKAYKIYLKNFESYGNKICEFSEYQKKKPSLYGGASRQIRLLPKVCPGPRARNRSV